MQYWLICDGSTYGGEDALRRGFISDASWTRQVQTGGGYWEYRYQDTHYTHYFWRWRGWSGWEDNAYSGTSEREVQTRTIYRYRDYRLNYPGYDPNRDSSLEEQTVATYDISGNILGLTEDYSGKRATVLVYKKTNTDPTQEQLEYVDQIILGSNNSYSFTVNVKEKPSYQETGDFIVTLSIEGCSRLVNIDVIEAVKPTYTVTFYKNDGEVFTTQTVLADTGVDVNSVGIPEKEGHRFVKWNAPLVNISRNMSVTAIFEKILYPVIFVDYESKTIHITEIPYGEPIATPVPDSIEGMTFVRWDGIPEGAESVVTGNTILTAVWSPILYTVQFCDLDGTVVGEPQKVEYGKSAVPPEPVTVGDVAYAWSTNGNAWWRVMQDMVVMPHVPEAFLLAPPVSSVPTEDGVRGLFNVELLPANRGDTIYYTVNIPVTEADSLEYINTVLLNPNADSESGALLNADDSDDTAEDDWNSLSAIDCISKYTEPLLLSAGNTVYAFTVNSAGDSSQVVAFEYQSSNEETDSGILPNIYDIEDNVAVTVENAVYNHETGVLEARIMHESPVCAYVAAYQSNGKTLAIQKEELSSETNEFSVRFESSVTVDISTIKIFVLNPDNFMPLCRSYSTQ